MEEIQFSTMFSFHFQKGKDIHDFSCQEHELIYFQSGAGEIIIEGKRTKYKANQVLFVKENTKRTQFNFEETAYICLRFQGETFGLASSCYPCESDRLYQIFKSIVTEYQDKNIAYYQICQLKITEILLLLSRIHSADKDITTILSMAKEIDENPSFDYTVEEMANSVHYSYDYFRHKFKSVTGKSPVQYLIDSKIHHACLLLEKKQLNCTEIAYLLGFSSSSQFSKSFKNKIGTSPRNYQKTLT